MLDDREMRGKIEGILARETRARSSRAVRLAAAVGASGKLLAGCVVVEYGVPAYGIEEDAAIIDAGEADASDVDAGPVARYGVDCDAAAGD